MIDLKSLPVDTSPQAQREAPGHGSGPPDPPQASHGQRSSKREETE